GHDAARPDRHPPAIELAIPQRLNRQINPTSEKNPHRADAWAMSVRAKPVCERGVANTPARRSTPAPSRRPAPARKAPAIAAQAMSTDAAPTPTLRQSPAETNDR